jgi:hypothetical protein
VKTAVTLVALSLAMPPFALAQPATTGQSTAPPSETTTGPGSSSTMTPSERDAKAALEREGYTQIRDVKSTSDGISAKATKDGQEVSVSVDSSGKVKRR